MRKGKAKGLAIALAAGALLAAPAFAYTSAELDGIQKMFTDFETSINTHDPKGCARGVTPDYTMGGFGDNFMKGRSELEKMQTEEFSTGLKAVKTKLTIVNVQLITPDVAFVDADQELSGVVGRDGKPQPVSRLRDVVVAVKKNGKWWASAVRQYPFAALSR
jgi:uncharacterized protein (TIGR02246 family)